MVYTPDDDFPFDDGPPIPPDPPEAAEDRRSEGGAGARPRKERVLHTRVSEQLSEDIRRAADDLRVPVSNLVRNVLEEAFGAVERVSDEVGGFLEEMLGETQGARDDLRRLRRRVKHLARRQRRRFARRAEEPWDEDEEPADDLDAHPKEPESDRLETVESEVPPAPRPPEPPAFPDVIGWQPLLANAAASCAACGRRLEPGERVYAGATERGLSRTLLCAPCLRSRTGA